MAEKDKEDPRLMEFLKAQAEYYNENRFFTFDIDFAQRLLKQKDLVKPQVKIYQMLGRYSDAVSLALESDKLESLELAKECANQTTDSALRKKLWLQILTDRLRKKDDIESVLKMADEATNCPVRIEDIIPHMRENIKIEKFKDKICQSLKAYNDEITSLKVKDRCI